MTLSNMKKYNRDAHSQSQQLSSMLGFRAAAQTIAGCFLLFWTFSKCPSSGQGGENQKLQGPPQLPDSPDLFGYWLSQGSAGALRVGKSSLKILLCLMGKNTAPKASTAVEIRASEGFLDLRIQLVSGQSSNKLPPVP